MTGTLVLSAWDPEIEPLRRFLRSAAGRRIAAERGSRGVATAAVGVGAVDAAVGAARAIAAHRPRRVIFVGTAGIYPGAPVQAEIGDAVVAGQLLFVSTAAVRGDGYFPAPQIVRAETAPALRAALAGESVTVACPAAITRAAALARRIARASGAALENLEAFAVARAAAAAGVEAAVVLGIANRVGPDAHREWRTHHVAASRAACQLVAAALRTETLTAPSRPRRSTR